MSATHATFPHAGDHAAAHGVATDLAARMFRAVQRNTAAFIAAMQELVVNDVANESELRKLYRLSVASETVTPQLVAALRKAT